jgi:enamine deaminase RidA (YjgF/YER057c/UK114 family)
MAEEVRRIADVPNLVAPLGPYVHAVVSGRDVHVAGQVAVGPDGATVGVGDPDAQARQAYRNLELVLAAAGCGWEQVLKMTVFLTDMEHLPAASAARLEAMPPDCMSASTVVEVTRLAHPDWLIEVEAVARLRDDGTG